MRFALIALAAALAALAGCNPGAVPNGGNAYTDTPLEASEGDFPGPSAQTRNRPLDNPAGE